MEAAERRGPLLLLCHGGGWDRLYQALSAASAAAAMERPVTLVLFFGALDALMGDGFDDVRLEPRDAGAERLLRERMEEIGTPSLARLLETVRETGRLRLLACSASAALLGHSPRDVGERVDAVIGWPTVLHLMEEADDVLYL